MNINEVGCNSHLPQNRRTGPGGDVLGRRSVIKVVVLSGGGAVSEIAGWCFAERCLNGLCREANIFAFAFSHPNTEVLENSEAHICRSK